MGQITFSNDRTIQASSLQAASGELTDVQLLALATKGGFIECGGARYRVQPQNDHHPNFRIQDPYNPIVRGQTRTLQAQLRARFSALPIAQKSLPLRNAYRESMVHRDSGLRNGVAFYGFDQLRMTDINEFLSHRDSPHYAITIDELNSQLGFSWNKDFNMNNVFQLINYPPQNGCSPLAKEWQVFLRNNINRLDIFNDIYPIALNVFNEIDKDKNIAALKSLVRKNLSQEQFDFVVNVEGSQHALSEFVNDYINFKNNPTQNPDPFTNVRKYNQDFLDAMTHLSASHLFRQTSKLGLSFFRNKGIPIVFHWTDGRGIPLEPGDPNPGMRWMDVTATQGKYKFITLSEMHEVQKKNIPVYRVYM